MAHLITAAPTIAHLLAERFAAGGDDIALHAQLPDGAFHAITWRELQISVDATVGVLLKAGVQPSDRVAQLSENRYEWLLIDFACVLIQAVHVPLHASLSGTQAMEQIRHSGAQVVAVSTREQALKLVGAVSDWPAEVRVIGFVECGDLFAGAWLGTLTDLCRQTTPGESLEIVKDFAANITPDVLATILYTSGTTGEPKGVMLTHGNLVSNASAAAAAFGDQPDEVKLNFLPLSHVFARTCDLYGWLVRGGQMVLVSSREKVLEECARFQPTSLNGVPYFYDRVFRTLCEKQVEQTPGILRKVLGGAIRFCCSGGAALPGHVFDYYHAQGVPLLEGYGLSESSPVITLSTPEHFRRCAVGRTIPDVEVEIADDGEIITRGPHVMHGYYRNPEATADVLASGWLKTGDLGRIDDDGFLYITGRKKELIVLSSGKNIAPVFLETLLTADPLIAQAMIIGDGQPYLTALIVPTASGDAGPNRAALYEEIIRARLHDCSHHDQVRRFTLLAEPFSIERGELTPKLSLRRAVILEHYAAAIAAMYGGSTVTAVGCGDEAGE